MRVLLAGASGAIGRALVPLLLAEGHSVLGVTRHRGSVAALGADELVADVLHRGAFLAALEGQRADAVVHQLTALKKAPVFARDMRGTNRLRQEGTSTLIGAARILRARRMVAASIFYGYGFADHGRDLVDESAPFGESDGENDAVERSLLSLEQQVHAFEGITLRYGLFYAPGDHATGPVPARWRGMLPMLHLEDAAGAVVAALASDRRAEAYNIADEVPISYRTRETLLAKAAGGRPPLPLPDSVIRAAAPFGSQLLTRTNIRMSTAKARDQLGWTPRYPSMELALSKS